MGENYLKSRAHSVARNNTVLEMQAKKVRLKIFFWGDPQVVQLRWKCTGTPTTINKHDYLTDRLCIPFFIPAPAQPHFLESSGFRGLLRIPTPQN